jgi:uncharacterized protein YkuJ
MRKIVFVCILSLVTFGCFAQHSKYKNIDEAVEKLGPLNNFNVAVITDTITEKFADNEQKARAIFYWVANNIQIDPKGTRQNDDKNILAEKVIALRKATPLGFSLLVQEMCSAVNIRCLSVDGYVKNYAAEIKQTADEKNYSWNVIQLGQSPETWYYVDAARASGYLDKKGTIFTKQFTSEYFFADRKLFNLAYFPDNSAWQLGGGIKNVKDYYALPVFNNYSFALGLSKPAPITGFIKTTLKKPVVFTFPVNSAVEIKNISLIMGDDKKQSKPEAMNFENNGGVISFTYQFKKEDTFPLRVVADGKDILQYMVEVTE